MKNILRQLLCLFFSVLLWYAVIFTFSLIIYPNKKYIDTQEVEAFASEPSLVVFGLTNFIDTCKNKIFLMGSSDVREGFRPKELKAFFPEHEVHNLSLGASNITEVTDEFNLITLIFPADIIKKSIFVLGIWYGTFIDDQKLWQNGYTNIMKHEAHSFLYKVDNKKISLTVKREILPYFTTLLKPIFVSQHFVSKVYFFKEGISKFLQILFEDRKFDFSVFNQRAYPIINDMYNQKALMFWADFMGIKNGSLKEEQFEKFIILCKQISAFGSKLIIVDMPLPEWHRNHSSLYADYQKKKVFFLNKITNFSNIYYLNIQESQPDFYFYDSVHPKPQITKFWSNTLRCAILSNGMQLN